MTYILKVDILSNQYFNKYIIIKFNFYIFTCYLNYVNYVNDVWLFIIIYFTYINIHFKIENTFC